MNDPAHPCVTGCSNRGRTRYATVYDGSLIFSKRRSSGVRVRPCEYRTGDDCEASKGTSAIMFRGARAKSEEGQAADDLVDIIRSYLK